MNGELDRKVKLPFYYCAALSRNYYRQLWQSSATYRGSGAKAWNCSTLADVIISVPTLLSTECAIWSDNVLALSMSLSLLCMCHKRKSPDLREFRIFIGSYQGHVRTKHVQLIWVGRRPEVSVLWTAQFQIYQVCSSHSLPQTLGVGNCLFRISGSQTMPCKLF